VIRLPSGHPMLHGFLDLFEAAIERAKARDAAAACALEAATKIANEASGRPLPEREGEPPA
jgi:hypothetical protein